MTNSFVTPKFMKGEENTYNVKSIFKEFTEIATPISPIANSYKIKLVYVNAS